jgi:hypothetical protein
MREQEGLFVPAQPESRCGPVRHSMILTVVPVPLSGGKAVLSMIPKVAGEHTITVHYGGVNGSFAGSTAEAALTVYP